MLSCVRFVQMQLRTAGIFCGALSLFAGGITLVAEPLHALDFGADPA